MHKFLIKLYVTGETPRARRAIANLRRICDDELESTCSSGPNWPRTRRFWQRRLSSRSCRRRFAASSAISPTLRKCAWASTWPRAQNSALEEAEMIDANRTKIDKHLSPMDRDEMERMDELFKEQTAGREV